MKDWIYILLLALLGTSFTYGQQDIDTVCTNSGNSNFGVPHDPSLTYYWSVTGGVIISPIDSSAITVQWNNIPGIYEVSVYTSNGTSCPGDTSHYTIVMQSPNLAFGKGPSIACAGSYVVFESTIQGNYKWEGGQTSRTIGFIAEKDTVIELIAINAPCPNDTIRYFLTVEESPTASMNNVNDTILIGSSETFYYTGQVNNPDIEWLHNGNSISTRNAVSIQFETIGDHEVTQVVRKGSCADTIRQWIYVDDILKVFIPNAFTPNGDGYNDLFMFGGVGIQSYEAQIFNRWGEMIYEWNNLSPIEGWDGTNSGRESKVDAYIYQIVVTDFRGEQHVFTNQFSLLR